VTPGEILVREVICVRVLVATASRHGSTGEVALAMGQALRARGLAADVCAVDEVVSVDDYRAVVLGSAVYHGRWIPAAVSFAEAHADALAGVPVWLFSSGPVGDPNLHTAPADAEAVTRLLGAREHRTFAGRLGKQDLDEEERAGVTSIQREEVDYRDWAAVRRWAAGIADTVLGEAAG